MKCCQNNNFQVFSKLIAEFHLCDVLGCLNSVHFRHVHVHQDQIYFVYLGSYLEILLKLSQALLPTVSAINAVNLFYLLQNRLQPHDIEGRVIDNQHVHPLFLLVEGEKLLLANLELVAVEARKNLVKLILRVAAVFFDAETVQ